MASSTYWSDRELVVSVEGPEGFRELPLHQPFARIGTQQSADVVLTGSHLGLRWFYLQATPNGIYCVDLRSQNEGTEEATWLQPDSVLEVGPYRIRARMADETVASSPASPEWNELHDPGDTRFPLCALSFKGQLVAGRLRQRLSLCGRGACCSVRIKSAPTTAISLIHCALYYERGTLWAIDLLSRTGTWLDGELIVASRVEVGSTLRFGTAELTLVEAGSDHGVLEPQQVDRHYSTLASAAWPPEQAAPTAEPSVDEVQVCELADVFDSVLARPEPDPAVEELTAWSSPPAAELIGEQVAAQELPHEGTLSQDAGTHLCPASTWSSPEELTPGIAPSERLPLPGSAVEDPHPSLSQDSDDLVDNMARHKSPPARKKKRSAGGRPRQSLDNPSPVPSAAASDRSWRSDPGTPGVIPAAAGTRVGEDLEFTDRLTARLAAIQRSARRRKLVLWTIALTLLVGLGGGAVVFSYQFLPPEGPWNESLNMLLRFR